METSQIKLTPAEEKLIVIEREKKELADKEKQAKKLVENEKKIKELDQEVIKFEAENIQQKLATRDYLAKLETAYPGKYVIVESERFEKKFEAYNYEYVESKSVKEVLKEQTLTFTFLCIAYKEQSKFIIEVKLHRIRKSGSSYYGPGEYMMFIQGMGWEQEKRALKNIKTVNEKIVDKIDTEIRQAKREKDQQSDLDQLFEIISVEYPKAQIEKKTFHSQYSNTKGVEAIFPNGVTIQYTSRNIEGKLKVDIYRISTDSNLDAIKITNALKNL